MSKQEILAVLRQLIMAECPPQSADEALEAVAFHLSDGGLQKAQRIADERSGASRANREAAVGLLRIVRIES